ncbi:hypothetical protein ACDX66_00260 [Peribacillus frigoritolerans]
MIEEILCATPADNWLTEIQKVLSARRLGRQSAERDQISENKLQAKSISSNLSAVWHLPMAKHFTISTRNMLSSFISND